MPRIPGTNDAQSFFLRAFSQNPSGPAPADWPNAARLRKWLRRKTFRRAFLAIQNTHRLRSDLHLSAASAQAGQSLESLTANNALANTTDPSSIANCKSQIANATTILRLSHLRQRFPNPADPDPIANCKSQLANPPDLSRDQYLELLQYAFSLHTRGHPKMTVEEANRFWQNHLQSIRDDLAQRARALLHHPEAK